MGTHSTSLQDSFKQTTYRLSGHGDRNVQVLKDVVDHVDGQIQSDTYGKGEVIEAFQDKMAQYLGKAHAVFFPSGTMAQQIALRIWCDRHGIPKVAYHPLCHLEIHEENGLHELHHIESVLLADKDRMIRLEDVEGLQEGVSCVLLELPQREIGGQLPPFEVIEAISRHCRAKGIKLHLDGARLFEILPYYQKTAAEISQLFDSVYVSFYKGLGGIAGAILAADDKSFIDESIVWKRRHGGDLISLYPYILSADKYFSLRIDEMGTYYEQARELAKQLNQCHRVSTRPEIPVSNIFHVHFQAPQAQVEAILAKLHETYGIGFTGALRAVNDDACYFELWVGDACGLVPQEPLAQALERLDAELSALPKGK